MDASSKMCLVVASLAFAAVAAAASTAGPALFTVNVSFPLGSGTVRVPPSLFGLDLEFTRHDIFNGLSAQLVANRRFAVQPPGTSWPVPWPAGLPPRWSMIGSVTVSGPEGSVACVLAPDNPICGVQQAPFSGGFSSGVSFGTSICVQQGQAYWLRVEARADDGGAALPLTVSLPGVAATTLQVPPPSQPGLFSFVDYNFTSPLTATNVSLLLTVAGTSGTLTLASVSLLPSPTTTTGRSSSNNNNYSGAPNPTPLSSSTFGTFLRADVVAALKALNFTGPLRYPGGCFAPFYSWKAQLLSPDYFSRPTIFTPPNYCTAVAGGVNAYTDGFMQNGPDLDEYLALCAEVGAEPAVTVPLQFGTPQEVQDAADLVEYLNGDPGTTTWGKVRASRGHPAPYNVSLFYLGNEINMQARYADYPAQPANVSGPPSPQEYAAMLAGLVPALLAVDPTVRLLAVEGGAAWDAAWQATEGVGGHVFATSFHGGYSTASGSGGSPAPTAAAYTAAAAVPTTSFLADLENLRAVLDAANASAVSISCDEWGLGPPWVVETFNAAHGLFGASLFSALLTTFEATRVTFSNYFEPINEGALQVGPFDVAVTPLGAVFPLYAGYAGALMVSAGPWAGGDDVIVVAGLQGGVAGAAGTLLLTLVNRNATSAVSQPLSLVGCGGAGGAGPCGAGTSAATLALVATNLFAPDSTFEPAAGQVSVDSQGQLVVDVPAYSVVQVAVQVAVSV
jgi:hypothetical protein